MRQAVLTIKKEPYYRREAFEKCLAKHGYKIVPPGAKPNGIEDLLVLWNKKKGADENAANEWERRGGSVLVVENGYLQKVDKTHYAISMHGHNGSGWFPIGSEDRFSKLGFNLRPYVIREGYALVCDQRGIGSTKMASPPAWGSKMAGILTKDGVKVKLRSHPGNFAPKVPLGDDLKKAQSCVIWSSASGVQAMVLGIPVFYAAPDWVCEDAAWRPAANLVKNPPLTTEDMRMKALHRMSHGQWHHEEIATGEPLARMLAGMGEEKW